MKYVERTVCGKRFMIPEGQLREFEFWLGTDNPFGHPMNAMEGDFVLHKEDTGGCGNAAIRFVPIPIEVFMRDKCNAELVIGECEFCTAPATRREPLGDPDILVCRDCSPNP